MNPDTDHPDSKGMRLKEAAAYWPCSEKTLRRLIAKGIVNAYRITTGGPMAVTVGEIKRARAVVNAPIEPSAPMTGETERVPLRQALADSRAKLAATRSAA